MRNEKQQTVHWEEVGRPYYIEVPVFISEKCKKKTFAKTFYSGSQRNEIVMLKPGKQFNETDIFSLVYEQTWLQNRKTFNSSA
jgi:hypothetical protein